LRFFFQRPAVAAALLAAVLAASAWILPAELTWGWRLLDLPPPRRIAAHGSFMDAEAARIWSLQRFVKARSRRVAGCLTKPGKVEGRVDVDGWVGFFTGVPETRPGCLREIAADAATTRPGPAVTVDLTAIVFPVSEPKAR